MKKVDFISNIVMVPIDFGLVLIAALSAYFFRFSDSIAEIRPVFYEMPLSDYMSLALKVSFFAIAIFALSGFYTMRSKKLANELPKIITGVSTVIVFLIVAIFLQRELFSSRFIIILAWGLAITYLFASRVIVYLIRNYFLKHGKGLSNTIVLGSAASRELIVRSYAEKPQIGYHVVAVFTDLSELRNSLREGNWLKEKKVESIMQSDSTLSKDVALDLLTFCQENHLTVSYVASLFQTQSLNMELNSVAGLPIVEIKGTPLDGWKRVAKRLFDFVVATLLVIILSPLLIIIALVVKFSSEGSIIVKLTRVGSRGKLFKVYKFRSMIKDAHKLKAEIMDQNERADGPLFKIKNDPRVTVVGRWLRQTSLDELPQLFNVLRGQMSLVGPRPHEPEEVSKYERGYKKLLTIKPGITGMAQVSGRSNLIFAEEAKLDIFYVENWSVLLDLIILLKTTKVLFNRDEAH